MTVNLETRIDSRLWVSIQSNYENRNFTGAILDSVYFLSELIRDKSGLQSDGVTLIGQAFGGKSPQLKVNSLQTESDWNIQKGMEQILRGVYQSIRNPRSHEKCTDTLEDATAIILFIDYLTRIIDKAKTPFTKTAFLKRVFDPDFVANGRYAELLVKEIPPRQRFNVLLDVYKQKETGDRKHLKVFVQALLKEIAEDDFKKFSQIVSDEMKETDSEDCIRCLIAIFPVEVFKSMDETAKLRVENKLIKSIKTGRYLPAKKQCLDGNLGTWANSICQEFLLKEDLIDAITHKLNSSDFREFEYVMTFLFHRLPLLADPPDLFVELTINNQLSEGNERLYKSMVRVMKDGPESWKTFFRKSFDSFKPKPVEPISIPEDDIPF